MQIVSYSWKSWEVDVGSETGDYVMYMSIRTDAIVCSVFMVENNLQVAAIETMDTMIAFCRLSNMLCNVVDGSTACDDMFGAIVFDGVADSGKTRDMLHRVKSWRNTAM
jgi:hypothetical protein